ncbi:MAG TPA: DNA polymerase III subunit gamma/tau [Terriglobales bacterium]|nr:DNA polymerase III subunit gamma/tau [Terriglobales bacterium]
MSYQVLARKYRPQQFSEVIGQDHVTNTLKNAIAQGRIAHGYIFSGHRGIGKTTIARILAMALNCQSASQPVAEPCGKCDSCLEIREGRGFDVIEIDAATNRGIDEVRRIRDEARVQPARDRFKIFILDEAHQITDAAFNAILKTLEEPPDWAVFMMATTQPEDIPQTIRSRCQHFSFHAVKFDEIVGQLKSICEKEGIPADDDAIALLAEAGDGSMRDALSIMDQAISCCTGRLTAEMIRGLVGAVSSEVLEQVMQAIERNSSEDVLRQIDKIVTEGQSPVHFARQMVRFLRNAIVAKVARPDSPLLQMSSDERARVGRVAELFSEEDLTRFLQIMLRTHSELGYKQEQRFHLELGLLKLVHAARLLPLEQLLSAEFTNAPGTLGRPASAGFAANTAARTPHTSGGPAVSRPAPRISPFESDVSRKTTKRSQSITEPISHASSGPRDDSSAPSSAFDAPRPDVSAARVGFAGTTRAESIGSLAAAVAPAPEPVAVADPVAPANSISVEALRDHILNALENADQKTLPSMLEIGEWKIQGNEIVIHVSVSPTVVELTVNNDAQRMLNEFATSANRRPTKVKVIGGAAAVARPQPRSSSGGTSARARAAQDPIVQRMLDKFGGEIRTVMDQSKD